jgi:hypothetical protein
MELWEAICCIKLKDRILNLRARRKKKIAKIIRWIIR